MPLSKAKDRERKRKKFQPNSNPKRTEPVIPKASVVSPTTFGYATRDVPGPSWMKG